MAVDAEINIKPAALRSKIVEVGHRLGLGARALADLAGAVCEEILIDDYRDPVAEREARDAAVRRDFDGRNREVVCKKHGISRRTFYRALNRRPKSSL